MRIAQWAMAALLAGVASISVASKASDDQPILEDACYYFLPISGCSGIRGGVSGLALGGQVIGIMLLGFGCAILFGHCVYVALEEAPQARRRIWYVGAGLCAGGGLFFYAWAWFGHPLAFWGLRGYLISAARGSLVHAAPQKVASHCVTAGRGNNILTADPLSTILNSGW